MRDSLLCVITVSLDSDYRGLLCLLHVNFSSSLLRGVVPYLISSVRLTLVSIPPSFYIVPSDYVVSENFSLMQPHPFQSLSKRREYIVTECVVVLEKKRHTDSWLSRSTRELVKNQTRDSWRLIPHSRSAVQLRNRTPDRGGLHNPCGGRSYPLRQECTSERL